jgi:hypothetical protein
MSSLTFEATIHIHPRGQRAMKVADARVRFLNRVLQLYEVRTPDGMCWEGPLEVDDLGRMLDSAYLIILEGGRTYRVAPTEMTDRWYVTVVKE